MDKETLLQINEIICKEYLEEKDKILQDEKSDTITNQIASERRTKLVGMNKAMKIIDREISNSKKDPRLMVSLCSSCKVESQYPSCGAIESDYKFELGIGVLKCDLYEKR